MALEEKDEKSLINDFIERNNSKSFEALYNIHFDYVYKFVFSRIGNSTWTEDIVSETFITLVDVIKSYNYTSKFRSFIIGIAINKIRQFWSKKYKENEIDFKEDFIIIEEDYDEEDEKFNVELVQKLEIVLNELDEKYRSVIEARFIEKLSVKETAIKLNLTQSNVKVRLKRGLAKAVEIANTLFKEAK